MFEHSASIANNSFLADFWITMPVPAITANFGIVNMEIISAADIDACSDQFMDATLHEPVIVTKKNRAVGVFFSMDDIQDTIWAKEAWESHKEDYFTAEESAARLKVLLNADD